MTPPRPKMPLAAAFAVTLALPIFASAAPAKSYAANLTKSEDTPSAKQCVISADAPAINIRAAPGGDIIGLIPVGTPIRVSYIQQPWVYVTTKKGTGWVSSSHVDAACIPKHYGITPCGPDCEPEPPLPYHAPVSHGDGAPGGRRPSGT